MARTDATTVVRRLLNDETIHEQIGVAGAGLRDAYRRVRHLPPEKAIQDKAVYERLRQSASGLSEATRRALGKPEPKPPRRPRVRLLLVLLATGAVVVWASKAYRRTQSGSAAGSPPPAT